ncbi:sporulation protein YqfD [Clostridium sp. AM58-1XD]|uniref:sporulation protein YqfD n=1 Tax=Clostridium sp. AM58-1XD TaxID=2292307 RepID=UPI000E4979B0|nr:sporulation protein YqfD [Clostridium sp. AM58-1XD]RGZ01493.1 sporulation protein [Clostridium sp. AM58-1XD]
MIGFLAFFIFLYSMSLFIWDIEIYGNSRYSSDTLMDFLESQNIRYGMMAGTVSCESLESAMRSEFSEITWVSAQVSGTRLLVKIKENEVLSSIPVRDTSPCDIVAEKGGTITKMIVRQGTPAVRPGDTVEAGQILVSGIVTVTDDSQTVVAEHPVHADADIRARTISEEEKTFHSWRKVEAYTGKKKTGLFLKAFHSSFSLIPPSDLIPGKQKKENLPWKFTMEEQQARLFDNFYLPFYWGKITGKEYETYERPYTADEKERLKVEVNSQFLEKLGEKGVQIIGNNVRIQESGGGFSVICTADTEEAIGTSRPLTIQEPADDGQEPVSNESEETDN